MLERDKVETFSPRSPAGGSIAGMPASILNDLDEMVTVSRQGPTPISSRA
jgi:hypothetical protein